LQVHYEHFLLNLGAVGEKPGAALKIDLVVAADQDFQVESAKKLDHVIRKGVMVVDHHQAHQQPSHKKSHPDKSGWLAPDITLSLCIESLPGAVNFFLLLIGFKK
jgi:hypothetical protein